MSNPSNPVHYIKNSGVKTVYTEDSAVGLKKIPSKSGKHRNAIRLLELEGYPESVIAEANAITGKL